MPTDKRTRQRAGREAKLAAIAKVEKRRKMVRNGIVLAVVAIVVIGGLYLIFGRHSKKTPSASSTTTSSTTTTATPSTTTTSSGSTTTTIASSANDAKLQAQATNIAVAAGCPVSTSTRVNDLSFSSPPPMTIDPSTTYTATVKTTAGTFTIALDAKAAPNTVNSFVYLAGRNYFNCVIFHRVIPGFMDQTGDPTGTGTGGPGYQFANENIPKAYATGDVAMANSGPNTNGSQFFIVAPGGASQLDADLSSGGYSLFGQVTSGMNIVDLINSQGSASGVPPDVTQRILSVKISPS